jgi:hypothetical protein
VNTNRPTRSTLAGAIALGLVLGVLFGVFAASHGATIHGAATYAAAAYGITVAAIAKAAGLSALATVARSLLLIAGTILAALGAGLLRTAHTR